MINMKSFNADSLFEPIQITLGGKKYTVPDITFEMMDDADELQEKREAQIEANKANPEAKVDTTHLLDMQLAVYLGCKPEDLKNIDVRKKMGTSRFLRRCLNEASEDPKNVIEVVES